MKEKEAADEPMIFSEAMFEKFYKTGVLKVEKDQLPVCADFGEWVEAVVAQTDYIDLRELATSNGVNIFNCRSKASIIERVMNWLAEHD